MPIFRGPNGDVNKTDDDKTTRKLDRTPPDKMDMDDPPTTPLGVRPPTPTKPTTPFPPPTTPAPEEPKTTVLFGNKKAQVHAQTAETPLVTPVSPASEKDAMEDPVVGWIVVVDGPGKGQALRLGYGMNSIGRGEGERVCINFGDRKISRSKHAIITYDPKGRKFYVHAGDAINLTYLNDQPVLTPTELTGQEEIVLGETKLRFIPFCGENFDWQDMN